MDMFHPPIERRYYPGIRSIYRGGENEFLPRFDPPMKFIPTTLIRSHRSRWRIEEKIYEDIPSSLPPTYAPVGSVELHRLKANLIRLKKRRKKKKRIKIGHRSLPPRSGKDRRVLEASNSKENRKTRGRP